MIFFGPGNVVQQVVNAYLKVVAVGNSLIQSEERVPWLVGIPYDSITLPGVSPAKRIGQRIGQDRRVTKCESLAVIDGGSLWHISRQKWRARVPQILQRAAPENRLFPVAGTSRLTTAVNNSVSQ